MSSLTAVEAIFQAALEKATPEERAAYLDEACRGDASLREQVERLLNAQPKLGEFLEKPAIEAGATSDVPAGRWIDPANPSRLTEGPGTRIGPYKLLQQIGEGGMGVVYMAEQEEPVRRKVALKIIKPGMDSRQVIARFEAERQALAMMDHQNIARVLDAATTETGRPYFVMELVKGIPITKFCDEQHLTPRERLELFVPVCQAIQHAHQKGIIHRDIKPSNVLVTLYDGKPAPKVIDFGVAKAIEQRLTERTLFTQFGQVVGTVEYMSPEQAELSALDIDTRSDIYSLGVLLYELLTGTTPLEKQRLRSAAFTEMLRMIREEEPPKPSTRLSDSKDSLASIFAQRKMEPAKLTKLVRGELDWIVMKALEKDRGRRYETANGFARDLQRYLADEPVEACPPSAGYRLKKFARKNKKLLVTAAAFVLILTAGVVVSAWQAFRATRAESSAIAERDRARQADEEARSERDRVKAEKLRADQNLGLARKAVEDYLTRVTDDPDLKDRVDFTNLRKRLLETALPFYQQFALQLAGEPESRTERGRILEMLARVRIESGEWSEAVKALQQAREVYIGAVAESPNAFKYRLRLAQVTNQLAYAQLRSLEKDSKKTHSEALRLAKQLVADYPEVPESRHLLAKVLYNGEEFREERLAEAIQATRELVSLHPGVAEYENSLSHALDLQASKMKRAGRWKDAEAAYLESGAIDRRHFNSKPNDPHARHELGNGLFNYGGFLFASNRPAEALPVFQEASSLFRQLVKDFPSNPRYRHLLARTENMVGIHLARLNRPKEAVSALREAVLLMEQLPENYPHPEVHIWRVADFTKDLAVVLESLDSWDEARILLQKAVQSLTQFPSPFRNDEVRSVASQTLGELLGLLIRGSDKRGRIADARNIIDKVCADLRAGKEAELSLIAAGSAVKVGHHQNAIADAESAVKMRPNEPGILYNAACVFALAAGRKDESAGSLSKEDCAKRAVALLQQAVARGWKDAEHTKKDDDLKALRGRDDFKKLLAELEAANGQKPAKP